VADTTTELIDAYYRHWGRGDFAALRGILAEDFVFRGPMDRADGPAAFIELIQRNASMFGEAQFEDVRRVIDGARAVSLYSFVAGEARVPMAEAFEVQGNKLSGVDLYFDPSPFRGGQP
jgi:ketosteroid isomerase-like protein